MELLLQSGELLDLGKNVYQGQVCCTRGACWLTCEGQPGDHLLSAGESLRIEGRGTLLVAALRACRLQIHPAPGKTLTPFAQAV